MERMFNLGILRVVNLKLLVASAVEEAYPLTVTCTFTKVSSASAFALAGKRSWISQLFTEIMFAKGTLACPMVTVICEKEAEFLSTGNPVPVIVIVLPP